MPRWQGSHAVSSQTTIRQQPGDSLSAFVCVLLVAVSAVSYDSVHKCFIQRFLSCYVKHDGIYANHDMTILYSATFEGLHSLLNILRTIMYELLQAKIIHMKVFIQTMVFLDPQHNASLYIHEKTMKWFGQLMNIRPGQSFARIQ